jgi:hypothetical protein
MRTGPTMRAVALIAALPALALLPAQPAAAAATATAKPRVLAAGDSMIQIIDSFLRERLAGRAAVRSDAHISTGISKPFMLDWVAHARRSARSYRPDATIVILGANDGYGMKTPSGAFAPLGSKAWVAEYARRVRLMMRAYSRRNSARVYWLLLPAPRPRLFRSIFGPVNRAIRRAARSFPQTVRLVDLPRTLTPGWRFRRTMRWRGRTLTVRQADGVHLSVDGASIAATLVLRAMRRDGLPAAR